jgi:hypothetical protein
MTDRTGRALAVAGVVALGACGGSPPSPDVEFGIPVAAITSTQAYGGDAFACDLIHQPFPRVLVAHMGREAARSFTDEGASRGNREWEEGDGELNVEAQRGAYFVVAAGILESDEALLDRGLAAIEWGLAQQGVDGSFPEEREGTDEKNGSIHAKSTFIEAAARTLRLLDGCGVLDQAVAARALAARERLGHSARWMAGSAELVDFFARAKNTNQRFFMASGLRQAGVLLADDALITRGGELLAEILAAQAADGTFSEDFGFDASYQTVSIDQLTTYASTVDDPRERAALLAAGQRAVDRFLRQVGPDGTIDARGSTRTGACGPRVPGLGPKGKDIDAIPLRLYQFGYLAGTLPALLPIANRIEAVGQGFDHLEDCGG